MVELVLGEIHTRMDFFYPMVMLRAEVWGKSFKLRCWVCDGWPSRRLVLRPFLLTVLHLQIPFSGIGDKLDFLFSRCESEDKFSFVSKPNQIIFSPIVNHSVRRVSWIHSCSQQLPPAELSSTSSVPCGGGKMRERERRVWKFVWQNIIFTFSPDSNSTGSFEKVGKKTVIILCKASKCGSYLMNVNIWGSPWTSWKDTRVILGKIFG